MLSLSDECTINVLSLCYQSMNYDHATCYQSAIDLLSIHYQYANVRLMCYRYAIAMLSRCYQYATVTQSPSSEALNFDRCAIDALFLCYQRAMFDLAGCYQCALALHKYAINMLCPPLHAKGANALQMSNRCVFYML